MRLGRFFATSVGLLCLTGLALAQTPPGGNAYFGAPPNQKFAPDSIFAPPNSPAPPSVMPAQAQTLVPMIGAGADGGLLPSPNPVPAPPPKIWSGSGEFGINGATGNSELFNLRLAANAQRKTELNILTTDFVYTYTETNNVISTNQALLNARDEILFPGSPWSLFGSTQLEYDELRAYDLRFGLYGGAGYTVIDDQFMTFKLRAGAGTVYETTTRSNTGLTSRWVPELVFGYDFKYSLNDRSSLLSVLDYYPRVDDFTKYRLRVRAGYEYILDPATGTILRLGLQDRYDSDPGLNSKKNDLTYFATLGFKF